MSGLLMVGATTVYVTWSWAGLLLSIFKDSRVAPPRPLRVVWTELRPIYPPAIVAILAIDISRGHLWGWNLVVHVSCVANWFFFKDVDDDDRWKRRGRKVLDKIRVTDHGLVVAPSEATR